MLTNANHQTPDQRTGNCSGPTEHPAPPHRRPYWNETIAAFSDSVWLPTGTTAHNAAINRAHGWASKTAAHSWFSTNRLTAPNPDLPNLYSTAAVQATTVRTTAGASKQQTRRIQVYPDSTQKLAIATWLTASRWTYNLTVEILQSGIPGRMETHREHGDARNQRATSRMGFGSLPGEAHGSEGRLPRHVQRQNLQPGTQGQPDTRQRADEDSPNSATAAARTPSSPATFQTTP